MTGFEAQLSALTGALATGDGESAARVGRVLVATAHELSTSISTLQLELGSCRDLLSVDNPQDWMSDADRLAELRAIQQNLRDTTAELSVLRARLSSQGWALVDRGGGA